MWSGLLYLLARMSAHPGLAAVEDRYLGAWIHAICVHDLRARRVHTSYVGMRDHVGSRSTRGLVCWL
jgi:hypothetical protein